MKLKFSFILKPLPNKSGLYPIYLRAFKFGDKIEISTSVAIPIKDWSIKNKRVKKKNTNHIKYNKILDAFDKKALKILLEDYLNNNANMTLKEFKNMMNPNILSYQNSESFTDFIINYLNTVKSQFKKETFWSYKSQISKLSKFKKEIRFIDLTEKFLVEFREFMLFTLKNNDNTVSKSLRTLRTFINIAIRAKKMDFNPFSNFKIKKVEGQREYLDILELNNLSEFYKNHTFKINTQKEVLQAFLFSCYTGIRYSDIRELRIRNIKKDSIEFIIIKTNSIVSIPLSQKAIELINFSGKEKNDFVFRIYSNKVSNKHLKEISLMLKFDKTLTFHVARHTFATTSLTLGIPIEVVSKLLGHTNIRTTQIYAKIVDSVKIKEMKKWDMF